MSNVALLVFVFLKSGSFYPVELLRSHLFQFLDDERVIRVEQKKPKPSRLNSEIQIQYASFTEGTVVFSRLQHAEDTSVTDVREALRARMVTRTSGSEESSFVLLSPSNHFILRGVIAPTPETKAIRATYQQGLSFVQHRNSPLNKQSWEAELTPQEVCACSLSAFYSASSISDVNDTVLHQPAT